MNYLPAYLRTAAGILTAYKGDIPLSVFLRNFFKAHKNMGSRDRKMVSAICYSYYRCFHIFKAFPLPEALEQSWNYISNTGAREALAASQIFPYESFLGDRIDSGTFALSLLQQPDVFLRARPGKEKWLKADLEQANVSFTQTGTCFRTSQNLNLDKFTKNGEWAVVQDLNSQKVLDGIDAFINAKVPLKLFDCCAASGGKTILAKDKIQVPILITVSDIRKQILDKLTLRLKEANVIVKHILQADLTREIPFKNEFDIVIADVPCTGSGTWSRTPEQLAFFKKESVPLYAEKQLAIAKNAFFSLKPGGIFIYITCSVFHAENEDIIIALLKDNQAELLHQSYLEGYNLKADTLFSAFLRKPIS